MIQVTAKSPELVAPWSFLSSLSITPSLSLLPTTGESTSNQYETEQKRVSTSGMMLRELYAVSDLIC